MANLNIPDELMEELQQLAQAEKRSLEEVVVSMIGVYATSKFHKMMTMSGMFDDDITDLSITRETTAQFYRDTNNL